MSYENLFFLKNKLMTFSVSKAGFYQTLGMSKYKWSVLLLQVFVVKQYYIPA